MNKCNIETNKVVLPTLFLVILIDALGMGLIFPILAPIFLHHENPMIVTYTPHIREILYGVVLTSYPIAMFVGAPLLGEMSDLYGRKISLMVSSIGDVIGFFLCAVALYYNSLFLLILGRVLSGVTAGSMPIAQAAIVDMTVKPNKAIYMSLITGANAVGMGIGPIIGGVFSDSHLISHFSSSLPFLIAAALPLLSAALLLVFFKETKKTTQQGMIHPLTGFKNIALAFTISNTRNNMIVYALFLFAYFGFFNYLSIFAITKYGFNKIEDAAFLTYFSIWFALALLAIVPWVSKKFSPNKIIKHSLLILAISILLMDLLHYSIIGWILLGVIAIAVSAAYVLLITLISNNTPKEHQGRIMGVTTSVMSLSWAVAPLTSSILETINLLMPMFFFSGILVIALFIFYCITKKN